MWLNQGQAAAYLKYKSGETVRRKAKAGMFTRYGTSRPMYRKDELTEYLRTHEPWKLP